LARRLDELGYKAPSARRRGQHEGNKPLVLAWPHDEVRGNAQVWGYTVLASNATCNIALIGQLYRDRCTRENGFDMLKNQWGQARGPARGTNAAVGRPTNGRHQTTLCLKPMQADVSLIKSMTANLHAGHELAIEVPNWRVLPLSIR
jgi:hypothetical protein